MGTAAMLFSNSALKKKKTKFNLLKALGNKICGSLEQYAKGMGKESKWFKNKD